MDFAKFCLGVGQRLETYLDDRGFASKSKDRFVRCRDTGEINVLNLQKHSVKSSVSVNLGVHFSFLPKLGSLDLPYGDIKVSECEIQHRLTPDENQADYWWVIGDEAVEAVSKLIQQLSDDFFDRYTIHGSLRDIRPQDLENAHPEALRPMGKVRSCLVLARIHEELGDVQIATDFANLGIRRAGMAVGPKKALKDLLKRLQA